MANFFSGFAEGLEGGVRTGLMIGRARREQHDRRTRQELLTTEAEIMNYSPEAFQAPQGTGALPVDGAAQAEGQAASGFDGRTSEAQGYSGQTLKDLVMKARETAARLGDPELAAASEGRIGGYLEKRFQEHLMRAQTMLSTNPAAAAEEFRMASAYVLDGRVPQIQVINTEGGPVLGFASTDPQTGKRDAKVLTPDMITLLLSSGDAGSFVRAVAGIEKRDWQRREAMLDRAMAERKQDHVEKTTDRAFNYRVSRDEAGDAERAEERGYSRGEKERDRLAADEAYYLEALDNARTEVNEAIDAMIPKARKSTTIKQGGMGLDGSVQPEVSTTFEEQLIGDPDVKREVRGIATSLMMDNIARPSTPELRGRAPYTATVGAETAVDLTRAMLDAGVAGTRVPGLSRLSNNPDDDRFRYNGMTVRMSQGVISDIQAMIIELRRGLTGSTPPAPAGPQQAPAAGIPMAGPQAGPPAPAGGIPVGVP